MKMFHYEGVQSLGPRCLWDVSVSVKEKGTLYKAVLNMRSCFGTEPAGK